MPTEPRFNLFSWTGRGWRAVEAQHKNATLSLTHGDLKRQSLLEEIIDEVKPPVPPGCEGLPWLIWTPFRYQSPPPAGSRFRRQGDPGVFYGGETVKTACAEASYWRLRFWVDSRGLNAKQTTMQMTLFEFHGAGTAIDLTQAPLDNQKADWIHPTSYVATQQLASEARAAGVELIRYASVRDAPEGRCLAILTPKVFKGVTKSFLQQQQTWSLYIEPPGLVVWQREMGSEHDEFWFDVFS
jgi:hypothetical protein